MDYDALCEAQLDELTAALPNVPDPRAPVGPDEAHNVIVRVEEGSLPKPDFPQKPHWEIGFRFLPSPRFYKKLPLKIGSNGYPRTLMFPVPCCWMTWNHYGSFPP